MKYERVQGECNECYIFYQYKQGDKGNYEKWGK